MSDLWAALAIALIIEGMMPFLSPQNWRQAVLKMSLLADNKLRIIGLAVMLSGVILLSFVR